MFGIVTENAEEWFDLARVFYIRREGNQLRVGLVGDQILDFTFPNQEDAIRNTKLLLTAIEKSYEMGGRVIPC